MENIVHLIQNWCWSSQASTLTQHWLNTLSPPKLVSLLLSALKFSLPSGELLHNLALTKINCPGMSSCFSRYGFKITRADFPLPCSYRLHCESFKDCHLQHHGDPRAPIYLFSHERHFWSWWRFIGWKQTRFSITCKIMEKSEGQR